MNKIDEYHKQCSRTYGPMPTEYQKGVLQGLECAKSLASKGDEEAEKRTIIAYASGYEHGHSDTVDGNFSGNGHSEEHDGIAKTWIDDARGHGVFDRELSL